MKKLLPIETVVIPVAGYGTRSLPFTKAIPKVMLPLVDKPGIQYIVEEAVKSGIKQIIFVTSSNQHSIEDHFDYYFELEEKLKAAGKKNLLIEIRKVSDLAEFVYVRQKEQLGNAHAIYQTKRIVQDKPFCVQWGDGVVLSNGTTPLLRQLIEVYEQVDDCDIVLASLETDDEGTNKYAILEVEPAKGGIEKVKSIVEKPGPTGTKSRIASTNGYLLTPKVFQYIEKLNPNTGVGGELVLADAIKAMLKDGLNAYTVRVAGRAIDVGSKVEYAKGFVELALAHPEIGPALKEHIKANNLIK